MSDAPDRPRPTPDGAAPGPVPAAAAPSTQSDSISRPSPTPTPTPGGGPKPGPVTSVEIQPAQVVAAAGSAVVTAARVGRLLGRTGWRLARQLPGARTLEREAQRFQTVAMSEARRLLQLPQAVPSVVRAANPLSSEERRTLEYIRGADPGAAPLRSAMGELLERSVEATRADSRDYLYGTIISQLVPDEARILAALADGTTFAAVDVVAKHVGRATQRTVLANASSVAATAGIAHARSSSTYLNRLHSFGLVEFGPPKDELDAEYDQLAIDDAVQDARVRIERGKLGSVRIVRKSVALSSLGRDFWTACVPQ